MLATDGRYRPRRRASRRTSPLRDRARVRAPRWSSRRPDGRPGTGSASRRTHVTRRAARRRCAPAAPGLQLVAHRPGWSRRCARSRTTAELAALAEACAISDAGARGAARRGAGRRRPSATSPAGSSWRCSTLGAEAVGVRDDRGRPARTRRSRTTSPTDRPLAAGDLSSSTSARGSTATTPT